MTRLCFLDTETTSAVAVRAATVGFGKVAVVAENLESLRIAVDLQPPVIAYGAVEDAGAAMRVPAAVHVVHGQEGQFGLAAADAFPAIGGDDARPPLLVRPLLKLAADLPAPLKMRLIPELVQRVSAFLACAISFVEGAIRAAQDAFLVPITPSRGGRVARPTPTTPMQGAIASRQMRTIAVLDRAGAAALLTDGSVKRLATSLLPSLVMGAAKTTRQMRTIAMFNRAEHRGISLGGL